MNKTLIPHRSQYSIMDPKTFNTYNDKLLK